MVRVPGWIVIWRVAADESEVSPTNSCASGTTAVVPGRPLLEWGWLTERNGLALGSYLVGWSDSGSVQSVVEADPFAAVLDPTEAESGLDVDLPRTVLVISNSAGEVVRSPAHRVLTLIGSDHPCHIRVRTKGVSRFHAALVLTPTGGWLIDLSGHDSALTVDGVSVRAIRFDEGRELMLGDHRLGVRYGAELRRAAFPQSSHGAGNGCGLATGVGVNANFESHLSTLSRLAIPPVPVDPSRDRSNADSERLSGSQTSSAGQPGPGDTEDPAGSDSTLERYFLRRQLELDQMRSRFAETVLTTTDLLRDLRDDQSQALQREYEEVRRLSEEIRRLTASLADAPPVPNPSRAALPTAKGSVPNGREGQAADGRALSGDSEPRSSGTMMVPACGLRKATPIMAPESRTAPSHLGMVALASPPGVPLQDTLPPPDVQQIHFGLFQKITHLQSERESRFQKLMGMLGLTS